MDRRTAGFLETGKIQVKNVAAKDEISQIGSVSQPSLPRYPSKALNKKCRLFLKSSPSSWSCRILGSRIVYTSLYNNTETDVLCYPRVIQMHQKYENDFSGLVFLLVGYCFGLLGVFCSIVCLFLFLTSVSIQKHFINGLAFLISLESKLKFCLIVSFMESSWTI